MEEKISEKKNIKIVLLIFIGLVFIWSAFNIVEFSKYNQSPEEAAKKILEECKNEGYRPFCYEKKAPNLLSSMKIEEVIHVLRILLREDPEFRECHVLAHEIGEQETAKDPSRWMDVLAQCPQDALCGYGCSHGAAIERFSGEIFDDSDLDQVIEDFKIACEPREGFNPTGFNQATCYHGLGHLTLLLTQADVQKSLSMCDEFALKSKNEDFRQVCREGAFMQVYQPLEPEDFALIDLLPLKPTKENQEEFCSQFNEPEERAACWREGWPLNREALFGDAKNIVSFCAHKVNEGEELSCYRTVTSVIARSSLSKPEKMLNICHSVPDQYKGICYGIGASAIFEEDESRVRDGVLFCSRAITEEFSGECYDYLSRNSRYSFHDGSESLNILCNSMPEPWRGRCVVGR